MRVLYLSPTAALGGAERVLLDLLANVRQVHPAWQVSLLVANDGPLVAGARELGVDTFVLPYPPELATLGDATLRLSAGPRVWIAFGWRFTRAAVASVGYLRRFRRAIQTIRPDVLHSNGYKMHVLAALGKPSGAALVWHFHDYLGSRPVSSAIIKRLKRRCDTVITVSDSVTADIRAQLGSQPPVITVWNSVNLDRFTPDGSHFDLDAAAGLPPVPAGTIRVGLVATFARWKGHFRFMKVIQTLTATHPIRGYIVGGALYDTAGSQVSMAELRAEAARLGITDAIGFTGFVSDPAAALRTLDVVVHASTAPEPFGLVVAEAMASGRALAVSNGGGVAELITPEVDALIYPQDDAAALSRQVARLVVDASLRHRLGAAARLAAVRRFDASRVASQVFSLYQRLKPQAAA